MSGGCLALFALGFQFVVSFAHIHAQDLIPPSQVGFVGYATAPSGPTDGAIISSATPTSHDDRGLPHDGCAICASIFLLSNGLVGQAPVLAAPATVDAVALLSVSDFDLQRIPYSSFRTRAPPLV
jgi:hypothetical protein